MRAKYPQKGIIFDQLLGATVQIIEKEQKAHQEVKRRGCIIDLVRQPALMLRIGDEVIAYLKIQ